MGMRILEPKKEHMDYNTLFLRGYPLQVLDNARRKGDWDQEGRFDCANQNSKFADRFDEKYMKLTYSGSSVQVNRTNLSNNSVLRQICSHVYLCSSCTLRPAGIWDVCPVSSSHWHVLASRGEAKTAKSLSSVALILPALLGKNVPLTCAHHSRQCLARK